MLIATICIAIFTAVTAVIAVINICRDRYRIRAEASPRDLQGMCLEIRIYIVNDGRRPVTIRRLVMESSSDSCKFPLRRKDNGGQTIRLEEGDYFEEVLDSKDIEEYLAKLTEVKVAYIEDFKGKKYTVDGFVEICNNAEFF